MPLFKDSDVPVNGTNVIPWAGGGMAIDCSVSSHHEIVSGAGNSIVGLNNLKPGQIVTLRFAQDGVGGRTLAISNPVLRVPATVTITPNAAASAITHYTFVYDGTSILLLSKG